MSGHDDLRDLGEILADVRELAEAWARVGANRIPWEPRGPGWPASEPAKAGGAASAPSASAAAAPSGAGTRAPSLFPPSAPAQPRPRTVLSPPPSQAAGTSRWQGYGEATSREAAMEKVRADLGTCDRCVLQRSRTQVVFGVGSLEAGLVVVGEAPGFHEDQQGEPFVGPAGEMLDRMLANVLGLGRAQVYIMNVLKCRPPENRDPRPEEIVACRPFFDAQLNIVRPKAILALGRYAAQSLLDTPVGIKALRGRWGVYRGIPVMPTFHPAYLLRQPDDKRLTLQDLLALKQRLAS